MMSSNRFLTYSFFVLFFVQNIAHSANSDEKKKNTVTVKSKTNKNKDINPEKNTSKKIIIPIEDLSSEDGAVQPQSIGIEKDIRDKIDLFLRSYTSIISSFTQEIIINNQIKKSSGNIFIKKPHQLKLSVNGSDGRYNVIMNNDVGVHQDIKTKQTTYLDDLSLQQMKSYISFEDLNIFDPRMLIIKSGKDVILTLPTLDDVSSAFVFSFDDSNNIFIKEINQTAQNFSLKVNFSNVIMNEELPDIIFEIKDPRLKDNGV